MKIKKVILFPILILVIGVFLSSCTVRKTGGMITVPSPGGTASESATVSSTATASATAVGTVTPSATPGCTNKACSANNKWEVYSTEVVYVPECKEKIKTTEKWAYYHCKDIDGDGKKECVFQEWGWQKQVSETTPRNLPDGANCVLPGDKPDGYCKSGKCIEKTCEFYGSEEGEPCPTSSPVRNCCPNTFQCCDAGADVLKGSAKCCLKEPSQKCVVITLPFPLSNENACEDLQCPGPANEWHKCTGTPADGGNPKPRCCKKEAFCSPDDRDKNRCGDECGEKYGIYACSIAEGCPPGYEMYPIPGREGEWPKQNSVCCKSGEQVGKQLRGLWFCTHDECTGTQHICTTGVYSICCDANEYCVDDTEEPSCLPIGGQIDPFPWPKPVPSASISSAPSASP